MVAAKLLAQAAAKGGFQAQSFASYGALRRGGKVEGYVRISQESLLQRCKMYSADYLVVMDESLLNPSQGPESLKKDGKILINTARPKDVLSGLGDYGDYEVYWVDAYGIAREKGLVIPGGMPVINTALLGALAGILDEVAIEDLVDVIRDNTPKPEMNTECAMEGYSRVRSLSDSQESESALNGGPGPISAPRRRLPQYDPQKMKHCNRCQVCYIFCPTLAITFDVGPLRFSVDGKLCNGCGICIKECPRKAISWEGEQDDQSDNRQ